MANQNTLFDLSVTPASNLNIKGQSQQGTAPGSTIDNIFQRYGAALKAFYDSLGGVATVSGTDTYTVTITEDWAALASGLILAIKVPNANTGAATLNVTVPTAGALGATAIRRQGDSALSANDMVANGVYLLRYDTAYNSSAGAWVLLNAASSGVTFATVAQALAGTSTTLAVNPAGLYLPTDYINGLTITNDTGDATNDLLIAVGEIRSLDDTANINQSAALVKQADAAWAVGTNAGCLDTGSIGNNRYAIWEIKRVDTNVVDTLISLSFTAPTMPTNYTLKALIGEFTRVGGTNGIPINYNRPRIRYSGAAPVFACRAWVNFDGTGTVAIRASGNVSSITDNGAGDYTLNMTTALPDANYAISGSCDNAFGAVLPYDSGTARTSSAFRIRTLNSGGTAADTANISVQVFR